MLSGATWSAFEIAGTAVLRIVVSSDSMKNATARATEAAVCSYRGADAGGSAAMGLTGLINPADIAWRCALPASRRPAA